MSFVSEFSLINSNNGGQVRAAERNRGIGKETAKKVFSFYQRFLEESQMKIAPGLFWMKNDFLSVKNCLFPWRDLDVQLSSEEMGIVLSETGILPLRPVPQNSKILIVGCGNEPIADAGGYPLALKSDKNETSAQYQREHKHFNAITINPHLGHNPTLVGFFGAQKFPMLKTGQFDLIVIEGTNVEDTEIGRDEVQRLLNSSGQIVSNFGLKEGRLFSWEDNAKNSWDPNYTMPPVVIENLNVYESFNYPD